MTRRKPLPEQFRGRGFRVGDARAVGVPSRRLDANDLDAPVRGARVPAGGRSVEALAAVLGDGQAFTGPTAAQIWGMPLPRRWQRDSRMWVSTLSRDRAMRRPGVVGSRRSSGAALIRGGLPVLDPARTWASLGALLAVHDLVAVADRIVTERRGHPALASLDELVDVARRQRRGSRALRQALCEVRPGAWSRPESLLRLAVLRCGLPEPRLNEAVDVGSGRTAAPDLSWPAQKVCAEYDGAWHDDPAQRAADLERHELLADAGWLITHIRARDLFPHAMPAVARILRRLTERGYRHPAPIESALLPSWNS
ncbi:MAG TPA: hypothetical protein VNR36_07810 [Pseudolysinimonas sp.]|nr:hypothetical protein [Pseudolysinimonas sp.]